MEEVKDGQCARKLVKKRKKRNGPVPRRHPGSMKETALPSQGTHKPLKISGSVVCLGVGVTTGSDLHFFKISL